MVYRGFRDLKVYLLAYDSALEIFRMTRSYPSEERFSLTNQIRRASRSVAAQIAEAWRMRKYPKSFVSKLLTSSAEEAEVEVWLDMSLDCGYITKEQHQLLRTKYEEIARMLHAMVHHPEKFCH